MESLQLWRNMELFRQYFARGIFATFLDGEIKLRKANFPSKIVPWRTRPLCMTETQCSNGTTERLPTRLRKSSAAIGSVVCEVGVKKVKAAQKSCRWSVTVPSGGH